VEVAPPARHPILFVIWFEWSIRRAIAKHKVDLFFSPDGYLSLSSKAPQIGVIHDINFEKYPKDIPWFPRLYLRRFFPLFAKKATHLLTVSEYSKQDIVAKYGIGAHKITVGHNGVSDSFSPVANSEKKDIELEFSNGKPYFLFVGSLQPRKNLKRLIEAYSELVTSKRTNWDLVIVGSQMWNTSNAEERFSEELAERIHFQGHLHQENLVKVMAGASAFVYVPYFEGFGIPLLEAMRSGVPIVAGNKTALPEVVGDAGLLCNPFSVKDIADKMSELENNVDLRNELVQKGLKRSQLFNWDNTAKIVWEVIERELNKTTN
ncbi:MAG: glycosyltransferase family 4 protein, partial [Bacteroidetes bacterium]|nr:glycosyltransferase family 4 protein [Bacteroidota bacterium]